MPVREVKNPHLKFPIRVKTKKDLEPVIEYFNEHSSDLLKKQLENKKTFNEKVKFLRFMGYVE